MLVYHIAAGNVGYTFDVTPSGQVVLKEKLQYGYLSSFNLWLQASDVSVTPAASVYLMIKVNVFVNNLYVPWFSQPVYYATAKPTATVQTLVSIVAMDDVTASSNLSYSLLNNTAMFTLDSKTGLLSTTTRLTSEIPNLYRLIVQASDQVCKTNG